MLEYINIKDICQSVMLDDLEKDVKEKILQKLYSLSKISLNDLIKIISESTGFDFNIKSNNEKLKKINK